MIKYQNYHKHTFYTNPKIIDSVVSNEDYAKRASELGHGIISVMEHGWSGRYVEGWELSQEYNLKFIQGAEVYWVKNRFEKDRSNCHLYIGAMNEKGRRELNDILSEAALTGMYGQCRVDIDLILSLSPKDVIVTSACIAGWRYDDADEIMKRFSAHFEDNFFLEVQYHNTQSQAQLNERILKLHYDEKIPIIMGCDSHYIKQDGDSDRQDFLNSKSLFYEDEEGWYLDYPSGDTAYERFAKQCILNHDEIIDAIDNTNKFLKVEEYECNCFNKEIKMPVIYSSLSQAERDQKYRGVIYEAWDKEKKKIREDQWETYEKEIEKELEVVEKTKHSDYFLFNEAMIKEGVNLGGVLTKTGRGSATSFYTNKLAGFTDVDRIASKVHMYPERFMSPTRILETKSLADIDFNVADQEPFIQAQINILGENHSYPMIAYGTMQASAAWKMYAKSQEIDFEIANKVSEQIKKYEKALKHAEEDEKDDINPLDYIDKAFHTIYTKSVDYQGIVDRFSPHSCAFLIYTGDIRREIGLIRVKDKICCCMDGKWAEEYRFLKNDLLVVSVVDLISKSFKYAKVPMLTSNELLEQCPPDSKVWDIYKSGCTLGINQVEKGGTTHRVMHYNPTNISELCSFVAAIRPGFKSMYKEFESRNHFEYGIKSLDSIIQTDDMPHSFILYQEMSMAVLNYAGIPMTECYDIIKNIAKKRVQKVLKYKDQFVSGFKEVLIVDENKTEEEAEEMSHQVWKILEDSSQYSFNACVSGDTTFYGGSGKSINDLFLENKYDIALSYGNNGKLLSNKVINIFKSGVRDVFKITTESGNTLKCTANHRIPTKFHGEKCLQDIEIGTLIYEALESGVFALSPVKKVEYCGKEMTYDVEMKSPYHTFVVNNGILCSNSHSYCVSIDSLYGAYLKTNYPLAFYKAYIEIMEKKGDKTKMNLAKEEAEKYFSIKFPPYKYGQDNRKMVVDENTNSITNYLTAIKGFGKKVADACYYASLYNVNTLVEVLAVLDYYGAKESVITTLAKIGYFSDFGNDTEAISIVDLFCRFDCGQKKSLKRTEAIGWMGEIIGSFANGLRKDGKDAANWKFTNIWGFLIACEGKILEQKMEDINYRVKINNQMEILGYINFQTNKIEDMRKLVVKDVYPLSSSKKDDPWAYVIITQSVGSGKKGRITVYANVFKANPLSVMDVILIKDDDLKKNKRDYWCLYNYEIIN